MTERQVSIYKLKGGNFQVSDSALVVGEADEVGKIHFREKGSLIILDDNLIRIEMRFFQEVFPYILGSNFEIEFR